jgi:hypothetical protein
VKPFEHVRWNDSVFHALTPPEIDALLKERRMQEAQVKAFKDMTPDERRHHLTEKHGWGILPTDVIDGPDWDEDHEIDHDPNEPREEGEAGTYDHSHVAFERHADEGEHGE